MLSMPQDLKSQVEALLFSSGRKMPLAELHVHVAQTTKEELLDALLALQKDYTARNSSLMLVQEGDLWKLTVHEKYMDMVRKINPHTELTKTVMETLAVVAWKQPITQSEVIRIRTNKAYEHIDELEKMGFVIKEKYGRTFLLKLTQKFFDYFDLRDAQAARDLFKHIRDQEGETQKQLEDTEQKGGDDSMGAKEHDEAVAAGEEEEELENPEDRDKMVDEDEIDSDEALFVQGYEKDEDETLVQEEEPNQKKKKEKEKEERESEESSEKNE